MENSGDLKFEVGQLAEVKTFMEGFRGAWFRCKIKDIDLKKNKIMPEYFDFPEEEIAWTQIYELPHYARKSKGIKKQLLVRPQYPKIYQKSEMPAVNSISEVCVIINGEFKVDDLVDWYKDECYWSARVTKILTDDKIQIELPMPPTGQGGIYEAFCKDIRPALNWSPIEGWKLPTRNGRTCNAQLIFPSQQGMEIEREENEIISPQNASSTSHISQLLSPTPIKEPSHDNSQEIKMEVDDVEKASSSDSISTTQVEKSKTNNDNNTWEDVDYDTTIDLNINHEETLEASILDLEELATRIKWLRSILDNNNQLTSPLWKFAGHC